MKVLIAECMQEISSFNPLPSQYAEFMIDRGDALLRRRGMNTAIGGALGVFDARPDVAVVPTISVRADSAGNLSADGWKQLSADVLGAVLPHTGTVVLEDDVEIGACTTIDRAMVEMICRIGKMMGKQTIAEFAENEAILEALREIGVDYAQGYGVGRPEPFDLLPPKSSLRVA